MKKKSLLQALAFILVSLLLNGCYRAPVTPPPPTPCPWWGCGTNVNLGPTVTSTSAQTPILPTSTPIPTLPPTATSFLPTEELVALVCTYRVSASENSTARQFLDTGLDIKDGETLIIKAAGTACFDIGPAFCTGPDGNSAFIDTDLVGKLGDGQMFHIGSSFQELVSNEAGKLYLGFHDNDYDNNSGFFDVTVTIENTLADTCPQQ